MVVLLVRSLVQGPGPAPYDPSLGPMARAAQGAQTGQHENKRNRLPGDDMGVDDADEPIAPNGAQPNAAAGPAGGPAPLLLNKEDHE